MLPAHKFLDQQHIPYTSAAFPGTTPKGAANVARYFGLRDHQAVKTLVFETAMGERFLVMVGGDRNVISGHLKKACGTRNIQLASPETVLETTGYHIGSIPPFSWQPQGFHSLLDLALAKEELLAVGAGVWGNEIFISPPNLIKACSAEVVNLTDREAPVYPPG